MHSLKKVAKRVLASIGLLAPAQNSWRCFLRHSSETAKRKDTLRLYRQFISPGELCFDIGAYIGEMSEVMLQLGARVVAVEPESENARVMRAKFFANRNFVLIPKAVASKIGVAEFLVCGVRACSSMSREYVAAVTKSGRLPDTTYKWDEVRQIPTTTLDNLIREYGVPAFTKIDVEGFEDEVIKGCSQRLKALSFEFTPERLQPALTCIDLLEKLGPVEFNYTLGQSKCLELPKWVSGTEVAQWLKTTSFAVIAGPAGDLYARFIRS
jgi:FkbM family methyltransferase